MLMDIRLLLFIKNWLKKCCESLFWDSAAMFIRYQIAFRAFRADRKSYQYSKNSSGTDLEQVVHTHRTSWRNGWPRWFCSLNPNPHSWIFTSVSEGSSPLSYLITSATVQIPSHYIKMWPTEPLRSMTLHFRDRRGAVTEIAPKSPFVCLSRSPISLIWLPV